MKRLNFSSSGIFLAAFLGLWCFATFTAAAVTNEQTCGTGKVISRLINDESGNLKITCVELNCTRIREEKEKCASYGPTCEPDRWIRAIAYDESGQLVLRCCKYSKITDLKRKDTLKSPETFKTEYVQDEKTEQYYHEIISNIKSNGDKTYELTTNHLKCVPPPGTTQIGKLELNGPRGGTPRIEVQTASGVTAVGAVCFASDSVVETPTGTKTMSQLKIGDPILVATDGTIHQYDKVTYFLHRDPNLSAPFLELATSSGHVISLTGDHLIAVVECGFDASRFRIQVNDYYRFARDVVVGDCVLSRNQFNQSALVEPVVRIEHVTKRGVYAPVTARGNLFVNNVVASCFSRTKQTVLLRNYFEQVVEWIGILRNILPSALVEDYLGLIEEPFGMELEQELTNENEAAKQVQFPRIVQGLFNNLGLLLPEQATFCSAA